jgi:anti-anti-sigma factor
LTGAEGRTIIPPRVHREPIAVGRSAKMVRRTIEVSRQGGIVVLALQGEHDLSTTPSIREELERAYASSSTVIVDLSETEFLDSSVLQGLLYGRDQVEHVDEHRLALVVPEDGVAGRLVSLTRLGELIPTYPTRSEALAALGP